MAETWMGSMDSKEKQEIMPILPVHLRGRSLWWSGRRSPRDGRDQPAGSFRRFGEHRFRAGRERKSLLWM